MNKEKIDKAVSIMLGIILGSILLFFAVRYIIPATSPFLIAWAIAYLVRKPSAWISRFTHIPEGIVRLFVAIFVTLGVFALLGTLVWQTVEALWELLSDAGEGGALNDLLTAISSPKLSIFGNDIPEELSLKISEALGSMLTGIFNRLAALLTSWVSAVPRALFFLLVTLISLIYFALDLEKISTKLTKFLPQKLSSGLSRLRTEFFAVAGKYAKSYILLLLITFSIMLTGFFLLGVSNALLIATVVAILDLLPVIGVGTVLVPWSVFAFISGNGTQGIGLLVLFAVNVVVRQLAEPKILGKNLNMHPILTLVFLYVGYALFGLAGLLIVPVGAVLLGFLFKNKSAADIGEWSGG